MTLNSSSSKRRRITPACHLKDLPVKIFVEVANFLAPTSKILYAIAVDPIMIQHAHNQNIRSIVGDEWDTLDFGDVEEKLAANLTDDDINEVLLYIDAAHKVKRLRLSNCRNITGAGLRSLRYSTVIEQIDLSVVDSQHRGSTDERPLTLSYDSVLPILESMIRLEDNSLNLLHFPRYWRYNSEPGIHQFRKFIKLYNRHVIGRHKRYCGKCKQEWYSSDVCRMEDDVNDYYFGLQLFDVCTVCTTGFCPTCKNYDGLPLVHHCPNCQRGYCAKCSKWVKCGSCGEELCMDCTPRNPCAGRHCKETFCNVCLSYNTCEFCDDCWCSKCDYNGAYPCYDCEEKCCNECRLGECHREDNVCKGCVSMVSSLILEENRHLHTAIEELKESIKSIEQGNNELEEENNTMRQKLSLVRAVTRLS